MPSPEPRPGFAGAVSGFTDLVHQVERKDWHRPALGVWDVRGLVGHTSRALSTVEAYLGRPADGTHLEGPVDYFLAASVGAGGPEARRHRDDGIADRGRDAGAALGDDPAAAVADLARRVTGLLQTTADDTLLGTPFGPMTLAGYLPTRTFELAVHSLDLARALDLAVPMALEPAIGASCELAGRLAARLPTAPDLLLLLTGRAVPPEGLSVV